MSNPQKPPLKQAKLDTVRRMGKLPVSLKHWPYLALAGVARMVCLLPVRWWLGLGRGIGHVGYLAAKPRRRIAEINIRLCFPDLDAQEREDLVRRTFLSVGMLAMEMVFCWFRPAKILARRMEIHGLDVLREAQSEGRGVLLIGGHYLTLDLGAALLSTQVELDAVYRRNKNEAIERLMVEGRERFLRPRDRTQRHSPRDQKSAQFTDPLVRAGSGLWDQALGVRAVLRPDGGDHRHVPAGPIDRRAADSL